MSPKKYSFSLEIEGPFAMFANPSSGSETASYPVPPYSAVKGMIEAILWWPVVEVVPIKIHICKPVKCERFGFNCTTSHLRKGTQKADGTTLQRSWNVLSNPIYQIFAEARAISLDDFRLEKKDVSKFININASHAFIEVFNRRLVRGSFRRSPCLGSVKFIATYVGPIRENNKPCEDVNIEIPQLLHHRFDHNQLGSKLATRFDHKVKVEKGVLIYVNA